MVCLGIISWQQLLPAVAQSDSAVERQEEAIIERHALPTQAPRRPVVQPQPAPQRSAPRSPTPTRPAAPQPQTAAEPEPAPAPPVADTEAATETATDSTASPLSQYVLQFNRAPVVGNALQLEGVLSQARLGFPRPRSWQVESAKVQLRFRHSPALYADRSNLTVRFNNIHLGSVPLNRQADEIGNVLFNVPLELIQDYNTIIIEAQQHSSRDCTDPSDPTLWTEVLPDSQVLLNYRPRAIPLDFANYPHPFLHPQGLDADQLVYLRPQAVGDVWLTAAARFQTQAARLSNYRPLQNRVIEQLDQLQARERLVIIGTPESQPALAQLELPFTIEDNKVRDGDGNVLPDGVGVLMLTTIQQGSSPVLVATGNDPAGVLKGVQALVQRNDRELLTGQAVLVNEVAAVPSPEPRDWPGYLPASGRRVQLSQLETLDGSLFQDVTVDGLPVPPPVEIPLRTHPDDRFSKGSTFKLHYSYGPGVDPKKSSVTVRLNGQGVGGERLKSANGGSDSLTVDLPKELMTPNSKLAVQFYTYPQVPLACGDLPDQPMWGTVHGDSVLKLNRGNIAQLPDLKLLQTGYPLTAPQDFSRAAFVLPQKPSQTDLETMLQVSSRLGRLSRSDSVQLEAYRADTLPEEVRQERHLVAIGERQGFPLPQALADPSGLVLEAGFLRRRERSQVQALPDQAGAVQAQVSPWNDERLLLGLTSQSATGLESIKQLFAKDGLFTQLAGDTVLVNPPLETPEPFNPNDGYTLTTLERTSPHTLDRRDLLSRTVAFLQAHWLLLPIGVVLIALIGYGISQMYLNRLTRSGEMR